MKETFIIGRGNACDIVLQNNQVSVQHAELKIGAQGEIFLIDRDSSGGTFVNDKRISRMKICEEDSVRLATVPFDLKKYFIIQQCTVIGTRPDENDFTFEFSQICRQFEAFQREKDKATREGQGNRNIIRSLLMPLPYIGPLLGQLVMVDAKRNAEMRERLAKIDARFMARYVCPRCGNPPRMPWQIYQETKRCHVPSCKAIFFKP